MSARLRTAINCGILSDNASAQAHRLLDRLEAGVRIVILGPPSVGKSQLCNALVAQAPDAHTPITSRVFRADGAIVNEAALSSEFAECSLLQLAPDLLGPVVLVDVHAPSERAATPETLLADAASADVVIWCTQSFSQEERALWRHIPDRLKDHSFLVLTKADLQPSASKLTELIGRLQSVANTEFHGFFPTRTLETEQVLRAEGSLGDKLLSTSGVKALRSSVKALVEAGCQADLDGALLFLDRVGFGTAEAVLPDAAQNTDHKGSTSLGLAYQQLMTRACDLAEMVFDETQGDMTDILNSCSDVAEELVENLVAQPTENQMPPEWERAIENASDRVLLLATENDIHSAADAVTILLQLKRDIEYMQLESAA